MQRSQPRNLINLAAAARGQQVVTVVQDPKIEYNTFCVQYHLVCSGGPRINMGLLSFDTPFEGQARFRLTKKYEDCKGLEKF